MEKKADLPSLSQIQIDIVDEAKKWDKSIGCCLSLPMGYGKTVIALNIANNIPGTSLVICSKTLINSWVNEIKKFFGDTLQYEIAHNEYKKDLANWKPSIHTKIVLTTSEAIAKYYTTAISKKFYGRVIDKFTNEHIYEDPTCPLGEKDDIFHRQEWDGIFIDECQNYTNISKPKAQCIASLYSKKIFLLSGTLLQEIAIERILGTFILLRIHPSIRSVIRCKRFIATPILGLDHYSIKRTENENFKDVKLKKEIVKVTLTKDEQKCYLFFKEMCLEVWTRYTEELKKKMGKDAKVVAELAGNLLGAISQIRQSLILPIIPLKNHLERLIENEVDDFGKLETILKTLLNKYSLEKWIFSDEAKISSRIIKCIDIMEKHYKVNEKCIVICSFVESLNYIKKITEQEKEGTFDEDYEIFLLECKLSMKARDEILTNFNKAKNGVLFLSYNMGAEGLNLQTANVIIHADLYWNKGKEDQALARVFRFGQLSTQVYQYILISGTGLETGMLDKHEFKCEGIDAICKGVPMEKEKPKSLSTEEIIKYIKEDDNVEKALKIRS